MKIGDRRGRQRWKEISKEMMRDEATNRQQATQNKLKLARTSLCLSAAVSSLGIQWGRLPITGGFPPSWPPPTVYWGPNCVLFSYLVRRASLIPGFPPVPLYLVPTPAAPCANQATSQQQTTANNQHAEHWNFPARCVNIVLPKNYCFWGEVGHSNKLKVIEIQQKHP